MEVISAHDPGQTSPEPISDNPTAWRHQAEKVTQQVFRLAGDLTGTVAAAIADLDPTEIDAITTGRSFWASRRWLLCAERLPGHRFLYLTVRDGTGRLMAFMPVQYVTDANTPDFYDPPGMIAAGAVFGDPNKLDEDERRRLAYAQREVKREELYPSLVGATPNSCCPLAFDETLDTAERWTVAGAVVDLFERLSTELECRTRAILYLYSESDPHTIWPLVGRCEMAGYQPVTLGADCVLEVKWSTLEEYVASFRSSRGIAIRRERRDFMASGLVVRQHRGPAAIDIDQFVDMQESLLRKYGAQAVDRPRLAATWRALRASLGDELVIFTAERDGQVIGFILFCEYENALYARATGFRHTDLGKTDFCYFNLLYYEPLRWAMERGIKRIHYGFAAYEAKIRRGCEPHVAMGYLRVDGPHTLAATIASRLLSTAEKRRIEAINPRLRVKAG
jgi:hypothetical protein